MIYVYNDYKEEDYRDNIYKLNKKFIYILNNIEVSEKFANFLGDNGIKYVVCNKIYSGLDEINKETTCIDAENYKDDLMYTKELAEQCDLKTNCFVLLPENLGGEKYKNYDEFIFNLGIDVLILERTYNVWKPWELLRFWMRNKYVRERGIEAIIGIWPETLPWICQKIQYYFAKFISNNNLMYYSESKTLPNWK